MDLINQSVEFWFSMISETLTLKGSCSSDEHNEFFKVDEEEMNVS